jgi:hypothetical protein
MRSDELYARGRRLSIVAQPESAEGKRLSGELRYQIDDRLQAVIGFRGYR